jgi:hypothetical protein
MMKTIFMVILLGLVPMQAYSSSEISPTVSLSFGSSFGGPPGNLGEYWDRGFSTALSGQIPLSFWRGYFQNWIEFGFNHFGFKNNVKDPIYYPYGPPIGMSGKDTYIFSFFYKSHILLYNERKRTNIFISLGAGYLKRTRTLIRSNSIEMPFRTAKYKGAGAFSIGIGSTLRASKLVNLLFEFGVNKGNTSPGKTTYWPVRFGVILK